MPMAFLRLGKKRCQLGTPVALARQGRRLGAWHIRGFSDVGEKHWGKGTQMALVRVYPCTPTCTSKTEGESRKERSGAEWSGEEERRAGAWSSRAAAGSAGRSAPSLQPHRPSPGAPGLWPRPPSSHPAEHPRPTAPAVAGRARLEGNPRP